MSATTLAAFIARCRVLCRPRLHVSDAEMLRRFTHERDADAFAHLLEGYASLVWGVCRRILMRESDCEDAFQAVFLALVRRPTAIDPNQSLGAWSHTVAVRVARRTLERSRRQRLMPDVPEHSTIGDVADELGSRELFRMVDEEIERLPIAVRAPLILCCLEGKTRDEAAETLGCSVAAVKSRLQRGRGLLRRRLERRGVQLPAAFLVLSLTSERIHAGLWTKTMHSALHHPAPAIAALAEGALPPFSTAGKSKLILAALLLAGGAAGALGQIRTDKPPRTPSAPPSPALAATEPKKRDAPRVRTDRHGDPLPAGAIARLGTVRWRHGDFVHALAYSPDGKTIATTGMGRALVLWNAATGKELRAFPGRAQPFGVAFSPDGKRIATIDYTCQVWDVAAGKLLWERMNGNRVAIGVAFAPDGKTLATADDEESVHLWGPTNGAEKRRINCEQGSVLALAYSPDGATLASGGGDGTIRLWDAANGKERRRFTASKNGIMSIVFSPDGKYLASGSSGDSPRLWDAATGRFIRSFGEKQVRYTPLAFSPDGKLMAAGYADGTFRLWDAASGEEKRHWHAGAGVARSAAFSPDGQTLATSVLWDGCIRLWDVATGAERSAVEGHHGPITLLRFTADKGTLISAGFDRNVLWWDTAAQTPRRRFSWGTTEIDQGIDLSPDGNTLAVGENRSRELRLWDLRAGKAAKLPSKDQKRIETVAFSPDGRLVASAGMGDAIHICDVHEGKEIRQIQSIGFPRALKLLFSQDGKLLACQTWSSGRKMALRLWDVASGEERRVFDNKGAGLSLGAFSPDGKVLAAASKPSEQEVLIHLFDLATGKELSRHRGHRAGAVAFSPDGKLVVSGGSDDRDDNAIHVWEAATGRLVRRFVGHHSGVRVVAFAADGLTVASSAGDSTILLWDITGHAGGTPAQLLTTRELNACWTALANQDAAKAYDAVWRLVAAPEQAVPFLRKHLSPVTRPHAEAVARWIAELDSEDFTVRQKASDQLSKLGDTITSALRGALRGKPSLETRRRVQQLLDQCRDWTQERLRVHRAIQVLERIGTKPAREVLQTLAEGAPEARLTEEAKAALRRMAQSSLPRKNP